MKEHLLEAIWEGCHQNDYGKVYKLLSVNFKKAFSKDPYASSDEMAINKASPADIKEFIHVLIQLKHARNALAREYYVHETFSQSYLNNFKENTEYLIAIFSKKVSFTHEDINYYGHMWRTRESKAILAKTNEPIREILQQQFQKDKKALQNLNVLQECLENVKIKAKFIDNLHTILKDPDFTPLHRLNEIKMYILSEKFKDDLPPHEDKTLYNLIKNILSYVFDIINKQQNPFWKDHPATKYYYDLQGKIKTIEYNENLPSCTLTDKIG